MKTNFPNGVTVVEINSIDTLNPMDTIHLASFEDFIILTEFYPKPLIVLKKDNIYYMLFESIIYIYGMS